MRSYIKSIWNASITILLRWFIMKIFFNRGEITLNNYIKIKSDIAHKYNIEESLFRMKKRTCDYGPIIIKETK